MENGKPVRVLIVDDSKLVRSILRDILDHDGGITVVGEAGSGQEAVDQTPRLRPDLIIMDIQMPGMDGFTATEQIMAYHPTPILIFSSAIDKSEQYTSFKAISLGALDVMSKPDITGDGFAEIAATLIRKVKTLARITVIFHIRGKLKHPAEGAPPAPGGTVRHAPAPRQRPVFAAVPPVDLVVIGASTGGPSTLEHLLGAFPSSFPVGICVVQHISRGFVGSLTEWLSGKVRMKVVVAADGDEIRPGHVYFAPDDAQMLVAPGRRIQLRPDLPPWGEHKPAVNHLFASAGECYGSRVIGVILTGMGDDGAQGLKTIHARGGVTIAQNQSTSLIFGMPRSAIELGAVSRILPLEEIPGDIMSLLEE